MTIRFNNYNSFFEYTTILLCFPPRFLLLHHLLIPPLQFQNLDFQNILESYLILMDGN